MAADASVMLTLARTEPDHAAPSRARQFSMIGVPLPQAGVEVRRVPLAGMRAATNYEVLFDDATAPADAVIGERGSGFHNLRASLAVERIGAAGISIGIGLGALELHTAWATDREAYGRPIGGFQAVQQPVADSTAELAAALLMAESAVRRFEAGEDVTAVAGMAKLIASETTARIVDRGMRAMAAHGYAADSLMQMYFRDARLQLFSPISNEMIRNIIGERLGLPRSY